jgi:hypothetical protein
MAGRSGKSEGIPAKISVPSGNDAGQKASWPRFIAQKQPMNQDTESEDGSQS